MVEVVKKKAKLSDLKKEMTAVETSVQEAAPAEKPAEVSAPRQPKKDKFGRSQAVGKKKNAIARVFIKLGKGKITVNGREMDKYFPRPVLQMIIKQPFAITNRENQFDVDCTSLCFAPRDQPLLGFI